jgi:hypothetical protein
MKILTQKNTFSFALIICIYSANLFGQEKSVSVEQNPKFELLLNEKIKINPSILVNERYKIQIYKGDSEASKKVLTDFKRDFKNFDATIIFSTPSYKVLVGNINSRIAGERSLIEIKKHYPNAILIKS